MATYYNIDSENQKYFENVNVQALPNLIKHEFDKIYQLYVLAGVEPNEDKIVYIANNNNIFQSLLDLLQKSELYITISDNLIYDEQSTINNGFEKLEDQNLTYYRIKDKDSFGWIKTIYYSKPFIIGYNYNFDSDYEIFSAVCKKYNGSLSNTNNLFSENYKVQTIDSNYLMRFAEKEGRFIKAWKEILKRPIDFKDYFVEVGNGLRNENTPSIDLSNAKGTEKIIMLHKLGVLDFLKTKEPFDMSINRLASAISGITGIDHKTVQSYINPIFSEGTNQKNNPLLVQKSVNKVEQELNSIGYKQSN